MAAAAKIQSGLRRRHTAGDGGRFRGRLARIDGRIMTSG
jgi:hypothetical protein